MTLPESRTRAVRASTRAANPTSEADSGLLPGWRYLEHVTPRRPARLTRKDGSPMTRTDGKAPRGRRTWGVTFQDPDLAPTHAPVTRSTGKARQAEALEVAKRLNTELRRAALDIDSGVRVPKYLSSAHVQRDPKGKRVLIVDALRQVASKLPADISARHCNDFGEAFAAYAQRAGVRYLDEIDEALLGGWCRTCILTPMRSTETGAAKWFTYVDLELRVLKAALRKQLAHAPQLNSDILTRALPRFTARKGGQSSLLAQLHEPDAATRAWVLARAWGRSPTGKDRDEGGKVLSQDTLRALLRSALRQDIRRLRVLQRSERRPRDIAACRLASVDLTQLLLCGFRHFEYTQLRCEQVVLNASEPMDRHTKTDYVRTEGKRHAWRDVPLTGYTAVGRALIRAQVSGRAPREYVSEFSYRQLSRLMDTLTPRVRIKDLRSTGCNYARRLHHIQLETRAARWGHTTEVHKSYYLELNGRQLTPCATLEEAYDCVRLMRRALRLLEYRNQLGVVPRLKQRTAKRISRDSKARQRELAVAAELDRVQRTV